MLGVRFWFKIILFLSLGLLASLYLAGCNPYLVMPPPAIPANTQLYQVDGAQVCDDMARTPQWEDDCNNRNQRTGYYYSPSRRVIFYRQSGGNTLDLERNIPAPIQLQPGSTIPMPRGVITNAAGVPMMDDRGGAVRVPRANLSANPSAVSTQPIRSSASFDHPNLGRVTSGKTRTGGRGVTFGGRSMGSG
jgi:hypothetical protein